MDAHQLAIKFNEFGRERCQLTLKSSVPPWRDTQKLIFIEKPKKAAAVSVLHFPRDFRAVTEIAALRQRLIEGHSEKQYAVVKSSDKEVHLGNNAQS